VCAIVCNKISKCGIKGDRYFVDEVKTQLREKLLRGNQTQDIHYSEDKASYKLSFISLPCKVVALYMVAVFFRVFSIFRDYLSNMGRALI